MTDIRRTLLWVVFSMSLLLIWDGWNKHNGRPSMFSPPPAGKPTADAKAPAAPPLANTPPGSATLPGLPATAAVPAGERPATSAAAQPVTVSTDVVKATLDPNGADVMRVELLQQVDQNDRSRNVVVLDQSAERLYKAQTGLISAQGGAALPNHLTPMNPLPGERTLAPGQNTLEVKFESPEVGGVKLRQDLHLPPRRLRHRRAPRGGQHLGTSR